MKKHLRHISLFFFVSIFLATACSHAGTSSHKIFHGSLVSFDADYVTLKLTDGRRIKVSRQYFNQDLREGKKLRLSLTDQELEKATIK